MFLNDHIYFYFILSLSVSLSFPAIWDGGKLNREVFNGRRGGISFNSGEPIIFTGKRKIAEWYAYNRGNFNKPPIVTTVSLDLNKTADYQDLMQAIKESGAGIEEAKAHSLREKPNIVDYLFVPEVRANLVEKDFDCFEGWDVLPNLEIMITAVFDPAQITVTDQQQLS